jgi:hypothetical protein
MLVNLDEKNKVELYGEKDISDFVKKDHPDFSLTDIL